MGYEDFIWPPPEDDSRAVLFNLAEWGAAFGNQCGAAHPTPAAAVPSRDAQSAIRGIVRTAAGAGWPGVIVVAIRPALGERSGTAVTDGSGQFTIGGLKPGVYTVLLASPGLDMPRQEGIKLPAASTVHVVLEQNDVIWGVVKPFNQSGREQAKACRPSQRYQPRKRRTLFSVGRLVAMVSGLLLWS